MALVKGVFDHVPQGTDYPFITIGQEKISDFSNLEQQGTEAQIAIFIFTREAGRKKTADIMEKIVTLLRHASLTISGQTMVDCRFISSDIIIENDGLTYKGTLQFNVRMREQI